MTMENPLADIVPLIELPKIAPHLASKDRCAYWLRCRRENGAEQAGAIWVVDGVALCSLNRLAQWLVTPRHLRMKKGPRKAGST